MEISSSEEEERINSPFVEKTGVNSKLGPQQGVIKPKQFTKVNLRTGRKIMSGIAPKKMWRDLNQAREGEGDCDSDAASEDCHCHVSVDQDRNKTHISKLSSELSLADLGLSQKIPIDWEKSKLPEKSDLYNLLEYRITNYIDPDIFIRIGNNEYRCHLLVLQCYSGFFQDKPKGTIDISEKRVTKTAFTYIYAWMLHKGANSYKLLTRDNILEICMSSQYLQVKELEEQCWAFIDSEEQFSEDKAFVMYLDARAVNNATIMDLMVPRVQRFFLTLVASKDFLELSALEARVFLSSNYICVRDETEVFMSAVRWLLFDWQNRQRHAVDVMSSVRFGLFEPKDLVDVQRNKENLEYQLVTADPKIAAMIEDGLAYAIVKHWNRDKCSDREYTGERLGLNPPEQRNWAGPSAGKKVNRSYVEFLNELHKYRQIHMKTLSAEREKRLGVSGPSEVETASDYSFFDYVSTGQ